MGILNFLFQWAAVQNVANRQVQQTPYPVHTLHKQWGLVHEFQDIAEGEIERFLPQICNILVSDGTEPNSVRDERMLSYIEHVLLDKCDSCLPFGLKFSAYLKACIGSTDSRFSNGNLVSREDILQCIIEKAERVCERGALHSGTISRLMKRARIIYNYDYNALMSRLILLGEELKTEKADDRLSYLRQTLAVCNDMMLQRTLNKGDTSPIFPFLEESSISNIDNIESNCIDSTVIQPPDYVQSGVLTPSLDAVAQYGLHYPFQLSSSERVMKIIRFAVNESMLLPSKERVPYLVLVEVLELDYNGSDSRFFYTPQQNKNSIEPDYEINSSSDDAVPLSTGVEHLSKDEVNDVVVSLQHRAFIRGGSFVSAGSGAVDSAASPSRHKRSPPYPRFRRGEDSYKDGSPQGVEGETSVEGAVEDRQIVNDHSMNKNDFNGKFRFIPIISWQEKEAAIRKSSPYSNDPRWRLKAFIVKSGVTLRREVLAMQLINAFKDIFDREGVSIILKPYRILCTGQNSGFIEYLVGTLSVDSIKKSAVLRDLSAQGHRGVPPLSIGGSSLRSSVYGRRRVVINTKEQQHPVNPLDNNVLDSNKVPVKCSLKDFFEFKFGPSYSPMYAQALDNFVRSLAGYSLVTYVLQLKDRHNANILIDEKGCIVHIDFGYILGESPGFNINFENAPFKLTQEYVDIMGGVDSAAFMLFHELFYNGLSVLRNNKDMLGAILQLYDGSNNGYLAQSFKARLEAVDNYESVSQLVSESLNNWRTKQYDWFQWKSNNIQM